MLSRMKQRICLFILNIGYTSGRDGFTTAAGDALELVQKYTAIKADNPLAKYLPELQ